MSKGLKDKAKDSRLGYKGGRPDDFTLGPDSTLNYTSSVDGKPPFSTYKSEFLRRQKPTRLAPKGTPAKYLDNPPE